METAALRYVEAGQLRISYFDEGDPRGWPVILLHGFPYDVHAYEDVAQILVRAGARVLVPYLRGYGPTRFLSTATPRSGQQAALGADLRAFMDALAIPHALLAGYDWGGRAACIVAALWPERCSGLLSAHGYNIQNIASAMTPATPDFEARLWYIYYFHSERGRRALESDRNAVCRYLWRTWSPPWAFSDATFARSASAFENPDFVDVVIHSYRHRFGLVPGDPSLEAIEQQLLAQPVIRVPSITIDAMEDGVVPAGGTAHHHIHFVGPHRHMEVEGAGHNLPQEAPEAFAAALLDLHAGL